MTKKELMELYTQVYKFNENEKSTIEFIDKLYNSDVEFALFEKKEDKWQITDIKKISQIKFIDALKYVLSEAEMAKDCKIKPNELREHLDNMQKEYLENTQVC